MSVPVPFYYNQYTAKERSYVDYMGSIAQSTANEIQANADRQIAANALFTKEIQSTLVSNQLATETALYNHTQQLDRTLDAGFSAVSSSLDGISRTLGFMGSAMSMGFASLNSAVEKSSREICQKLDEINETLKNPLFTESRELYNRALRNYNKTLYTESLEDIEEAIKKNKTEPLSYFLMGQTYLYGISEFSNVIDLEKAIEALTNAAKYITPDARSHAEIKPMAAEIYFYLGLACQTKANDDLHNGNDADSQKRLEEAKAAYRKSWDYSQNMLESLYNLARCEAVSGDEDGAARDLLAAMTVDPGYCIKVFVESDFSGAFRDSLKGRVKQEIYPKVKALFDRLESVRAELGDSISPDITARIPAAFTEGTPPFDILAENLRFKAMLTAIDDEQKRKRAAMLRAHIIAIGEQTICLKKDGTVATVGYNDKGQCNTQDWRDIASIDAVFQYTVGCKEDGTVVAVGDNDKGQCNTQDWRDVTAIAVSGHNTVGLKKDGTVVVAGDNDKGQCNTQDWRDITAISGGWHYTVGLKKDGTVVAVGDNDKGQCNTQDWRDIIAVAVDTEITVGLKKDGTVVAVGDNDNGQCNTQDWRDIAVIVARYDHTAGLKNDGTVVVVGSNEGGQCNTQDWRDIIAIDFGYLHTVGLKKDGTVVAVGNNSRGQCNTHDWRDIIASAAGYGHTIGLKKDGTVVAVGNNPYGQCDTKDLRDIGWDPERAKKLEEIKRQREIEQRQKEAAQRQKEREQHEAMIAEQQRLKAEQLKAEQQSKDWESRGLCRYCGGKIGGLFSKKCTVCGKPK